jgi:hypothetical protein
VLRAPAPPPRGSLSGRITRGIGILWILGGVVLAVGTATGRLKWQFGDPSLAYMMAGIIAAYGLIRYLRANMDDRRRAGDE